MKKPFVRPEVTLCKSLDHKLKLYSLGASAAGLSALVLASPADAKIVYTPVHIKIASGHSLLLDLNNDGINDFNLSNVYSNMVHDSLVAFFPYNRTNAMIKGPHGCKALAGDAGPAPLKAGAQIGGKQKFSKLANCMAFVPGHSTTSAPLISSSGSWRGVANRYVGVKFVIKGKTHYGWVRMSVTKAPFVVTLTGYAYETIPNKPIIAGKTKGPDEAITLQSGSLGHLAAGASAIPTLRSGK